MKKFSLRVFILTLLVIFASSAAVLAKKSPDEQRAELDKMSEAVLSRMYDKYATARSAVNNAYAYSTISGASVKYGFWGDDHGRGVAINKKTGEKIYVKMKSGSIGLNFGAKEFDLLFVITNEDAWKKFVSGNIEFGSEVTAGMSDGTKAGGAFAQASVVANGIYVYQLNKKGVAVELTLKGVRVSPYRTLNKKD